MHQAGFPQQWIEQGYAEWDETLLPQRPDEYERYCISNGLPFIIAIHNAEEARVLAFPTVKDKQLSPEGQEQLKELFAKYAWTPEKGFRWSKAGPYTSVQGHIPLQSLEELMPQVVAIFQQHLEPWIRDETGD